MSLDFDNLIDRSRLKRRLALWRLLAVLLVAGIGIFLLLPGGLFQGGAHVARIDIEGIIAEDRARDEALARVARNPQARALMVHISSPGGTVVGGESLFKSLRLVAAQKPVVAVMGTMATSGGYMAAIGADHIIAHGGTITGSIGVLLQTTDITGLLDKVGVKAETLKSDPLKGVPSPLEPLSEKAREAVMAVIRDTHQLFLDMVADRRGLSEARSRDLGDGRIYTGHQAVENGLVDAIGTERTARQWLADTHGIGTDLPLLDIGPGPETIGWLGWIDDLIGKTVFTERLRLDGLISVWHGYNK